MPTHNDDIEYRGVIYEATHGDWFIRLVPCGPMDAGPLTDWADANLHKDYFFKRGHWHDLLRDPAAQVYAIAIADAQEHLNTEIIGVAVTRTYTRLFNLWIDPNFRREGIGGLVLEMLQPHEIRAKADTKAGDPTSFYERHGFTVVQRGVGKNHNINVLVRAPRPLLAAQ